MEDQEDNGDELFENEGHDHESEGHHGFGIESDDHENDGEQFLIDANIHEESEQGLELEGEDHCSDSQQFLEVRVHNAENETFHMLDLHANDEVHNLGNNTMGVDDEDGLSKERYYHPPTVGMEFESYDDAYNYYNCYAKELGFAIRVKSSWTKRNSKEKRGAVLCCNCEGFKTFKEASCRRKETRTGCLAMMRLRLVETNRWRIDEAKLEHNHLFDPERVQNSKSHKKMEVSLKRDLEPTVDVEVRTIKLYRTSVVDAASSWNLTSRGGDKDNHIQPRFLKLKSGDSQAMHNYFCQKQLTRHPPQTIVTDRFKAIQIAISEVFPRAHHRFWLPLVMQSIILNLGQLQEFEAFQSILSRTVYNSLKIDEFETSWDNMIDRFGIRDHEWLRVWYEDREKWAPAYQKDTFLAGLFAVQTGESFNPFFAAHIHEKTSVQEFFDLYDVMTQKIRLKETLDDLESSESNLLLRTRCYYELQLSKFYTKRIFEKFQVEVEMMSCCVTINQVHTSGPVTTYVVKEHEGSFEVMYDKTAVEVRCVCAGFYLNGYLCRHSLSILSHNGVEEIPFSYILQRWRKDCKHFYVPDVSSIDIIDVTNPTQWYEHLHKRAMQVVEAGMVSRDHYMVAWQSFIESLNKVRLTEEKHI
ncbi:hypothetical protein SOVF_105270 isoform C [Spinacia oleracea]|nr:hypothetical protein SOVF_105270 isoform C [Spinacia oleracea]